VQCLALSHLSILPQPSFMANFYLYGHHHHTSFLSLSISPYMWVSLLSILLWFPSTALIMSRILSKLFSDLLWY
jgi:hypothetical protein